MRVSIRAAVRHRAMGWGFVVLAAMSAAVGAQMQAVPAAVPRGPNVSDPPAGAPGKFVPAVVKPADCAKVAPEARFFCDAQNVARSECAEFAYHRLLYRRCIDSKLPEVPPRDCKRFQGAQRGGCEAENARLARCSGLLGQALHSCREANLAVAPVPNIPVSTEVPDSARLEKIEPLPQPGGLTRPDGLGAPAVRLDRAP